MMGKDQDLMSKDQDMMNKMMNKDRELGDKGVQMQRLSSEIEEMRFVLTSKGEEVQLYSGELQRARADNI